MKHTPLLALTLLAGVLASACAQLEDYDSKDWSTREPSAQDNGDNTGNAQAQNAVSDEGGDAVEWATPDEGDKGTEETTSTDTNAPKPDSNLDYVTTEQAIPTGNASTSALLLTKSLPKEVLKNEEFDYTLTIENLTGQTLDNVFLEERLPPTMRALSAEPNMMSNEGGKLLWNLGTMNGNESRTITVRSMVTEDGLSESFSLASYDKALKGAVNVISPMLDLALECPEMASPGDTVQLLMTLSNTGTGPARDVNLTANLPEGLETLDGKREATMYVSKLDAGSERTLTLEAKATKTGSFSPVVEAAMKRGNAISVTGSAIKVEDTRLAITADGPSKFFLGTPGKVEYTIKNVGQTVAKAVTLSQPLPAGLEMVRSSAPAEQADGVYTWDLGELAAGESKTVTVHLMPSESGTLDLSASAQADKGSKVEGSFSAPMEGLAALHFALEDLQDPVPVGESLTYHVKVHNQGTAPGKNISVEITLDDGMKLVRAAGPTDGRAEDGGNKIIFKPLETLEPDATATWRLVVKSSKAGDLRLGAALTSERLKRPVVVTESTQFYE